MSSHYSHRNAVVAIGTGIVVTFIFSVMGQQNTECPDGGCHFSALTRPNTIVFANNFSKVHNSSSNCFPINTSLLYVCLSRYRQFKPPATLNTISRKCTGRGWLNGDDEKAEPPKCVTREPHCQSPPASSDPNIIIEIDGRNINIDQNNTSLNYSVGTTAIYKCKNSPESGSHQEWRCKKKEIGGHIWEKKNESATDLVCEDGNGKSSTRITVSFPNTVIPANLNIPASEPSYESRINDNRQTPDPGSRPLLRDLLIGICSFLGFVMIAVLFGILYKNRTRLGKGYNDTANHARQPPFTFIPEGENKSKGKFADGEENLVYANIIPIKVNQETIYAEVETGKIGKSRPINIKLTIDDDQLHTTYAEIRHSVIPEDQRR